LSENLMTVKEVSKYLRISSRHIYRMAGRGEIPCIRISRKLIRFSQPQIDRWLSQQERKDTNRILSERLI